MTTGSDEPGPPGNLSATSRRMLALRDVVLAEWEALVRAHLEKARRLSRPMLIDTLPAFYDNIAEALSPACCRADANDGTNIAAEHGGERARIGSYDHETLVREYQLFRRAIFDVLYREGVQLSRVELLTIDASIDHGVQEAVAGYAMVHNALRERFAAALTHDLRGPLGAIGAGMELILMIDDPTRVRQAAAKALDNVRRMDGMIRELLDTMAVHGGARLTLDLSSFDMREIVKEVRLDAAATNGARVEAHDAPEPLAGWWDRSALKRSLENLVVNALKYGRAGTPVTIGAQVRDGRLILTVHNEGDPIPVDEQECIFQLYRRAERARQARGEGWGVGLPYVRAVAESHAGSIVVDSHPQRGTTFTLDLPQDCRPFQDAPTVA